MSGSAGTVVWSRARLLPLAAGVWLALFAAGTLITKGDGSVGLVLSNVVYLLPHMLAIGLAVWAARRTTGVYKRLWTMLACAIPFWLAGELIVSFYHVVLGEEPPFPGLADGFFLAFYVALIVTFLVALRPALMVRSWKAMLDASVLAVAVAFIGWIALVDPQLSQPASLATFVGVAYPTLDVAMLTILVSVTLASFRRPPLALLLLIAAVAAGAITDVALTYVSLHTTAPELSSLKIGWETEALLLCLAAVAAVRTAGPGKSPVERVQRDRGLSVVLAGVAATLTVVVIHTLEASFSTATGIVVLYAVAAVALRLQLTSHERDEIAKELEESLLEQERMANTDELTGLRNRRFADRRLEDQTRAPESGPQLEIGILILDLDHFKEINDVHGHPGGDHVLRVTAERLSATGRPGDVVARYGGEEFVVILHDVDRQNLPEIAERFRECIAEQPFAIGEGEPLIVTTSVGGASMPTDASTLAELVRIADRALYKAKSTGRNRVQIGADGGESLAEGQMERRSVLGFAQELVNYVDAGDDAVDHRSRVAGLAGLLADELRLDAGQRWRVGAAARLHDIDKVSVPQVPAGHRSDAGADILSLAPDLRGVADVVREYREHFDGSGFPAGLNGEEICIEARIVSVCDAWVTAGSFDRPLLPLRDQPEAIAELRSASGSELDQRLVETLLTLLERREDLAAEPV
jgi:diguanylate cyclase (GGDEF)-like protein